MSAEIVSIAPATGEELWRGWPGDVEDCVERARRAWPSWAAQSLANRIELVRRTANELRKEADDLAALVANETGQPLWAARGEVDAVIERVELAVRAYAERTAQRRLEMPCRGRARCATSRMAWWLCSARPLRPSRSPPRRSSPR